MAAIDVKFSEKLHDQMAMVAAGGYWSFDSQGNPVMRFPSMDCYQDYLKQIKKSTGQGALK